MMASPELWLSADAERATDGTSNHGWQASGVSIDTRTLLPGDMFIALQGPNLDGHRFAATATSAGASVIVASEELEGCDPAVPVLRVDDTRTALERLGVESRNRMRGKVIAVTGSVGKTSTKEMLKIAFSGYGNVSASAGNLNNHWGLPLSLSRMPANTDFGIFELGMNHPGEIRPLTSMARPHVAIITAVEPVHAEHFNSVDEIADAKAEIFEGVTDGGYAVLNQDNDYFGYLSNCATKAGIQTICGYGYHGDAWAKIEDVTLHQDRSDVTLVINDRVCTYSIGAPGEHLVKNSAAVLAAVFLVGGDIEAAAASLAGFRPLKGRGNRFTLPVGEGQATLVDESYNASPASMRAAMDVVGCIEPHGTGRRVAVLGDMLELGPCGPQEHERLWEPLQANAFHMVFTVGPLMQNLWNVLPEDIRGEHSLSPEKLATVIENALRPDDVVMVKGSLGSRVEAIVEALVEKPGKACNQPASDRK